MNDTMLNIKVLEVVIMEVVVFAAFAAILVAAVCDMVKSKVREARRKDGISTQPARPIMWQRTHTAHRQFARRPLRS